MVHLEFGQDRMAQPVAGLRTGLAFGGKTARGWLCTSTGTFTMFTAVTTVGFARGPKTLGVVSQSRRSSSQVGPKPILNFSEEWASGKDQQKIIQVSHKELPGDYGGG